MKLLEYLLSLFDKKEIRKEFLEVMPEPKVSVVNTLIQEPVNQSNNNPIIVKQEFKVIEKFLPSSQYINEVSEKNCIFLHHTVSPSNSIDGDFNWWLSSPERVGCHFIIDRCGNVYQTVPLEKWIHHLYVSFKGNRVSSKYKSNNWNNFLNKQSIGIELDCAGGLSSKNGMWLSSYNKFIPHEDVYELPSSFRGYKAFEKYYPEQLKSLEDLLLFLLNLYPNIKQSCKDIKDYSNIFNINEDALKGTPGLYGHVSIRSEKSDPFPDKNLINLLNKLYTKL